MKKLYGAITLIILLYLPTFSYSYKIKQSQIVNIVDHSSNYYNKRFRNGCSGFISYLFSIEGIKLIHPSTLKYSKYGGTFLIYKSMRYYGKIHRKKKPKSGDLIFFHNTYDKNRDRKRNDYLTHIGLVQRVDAKGNITFVHHLNPRMGVIQSVMNLYYPNNRKLNSHISRRRSGKLAGQLFAGFATVLRN